MKHAATTTPGGLLLRSWGGASLAACSCLLLLIGAGMLNGGGGGAGGTGQQQQLQQPQRLHASTSSSTRPLTVVGDLRIHPRPDELCLGAPYSQCIRVPMRPEDVFVELINACPARGCDVLDIGSNRGAFVQATLTHSPRSRVVAFEPHPTLAMDLELRFGTEKNVVIHKAGLSVAPGKAYAAVSFDATGGYQAARFVKSCDQVREENRKRLNQTCLVVPTVALDDVIDTHSHIMKIDVQGHELDAVLGGYSLLANRRFDVIITEFAPSLFESEAHARLYLKLIASKGYRIYAQQHITPDFKLSEVDLPPEGVQISTWEAVRQMRMTGAWLDVLCVRDDLILSER